MKLLYSQLKELLNGKLIKYGFSSIDSDIISEIFTESTFDGVFSHGINRFPLFIDFVKKTIVKISEKPSLVNAFGAFEQWNGNLGPGILNALHASNRAVELAMENGIGLVGLQNTNHWMRAGTYGRKVAEKGFMLIGWTNTIPNMPAWGGEISNIGNNPFVFAIPHKNGPIVLDMAMSQFAYGKLEWMTRMGKDLSDFGGYNSKGELTKNPAEILESQRILPTGLWKGSAMAIVLDLAAAILSGGKTSKQIGEKDIETSLSQVFIAINIEKFFSEEARETLINETLEFIQFNNAEVGYPGKRVMKNRMENLKNGIDIPENLIQKINSL
ncbi:MAG: 3-dehydro-L-gulonate 2-dehydrogenase [Bacteroidales bacterium]|nr:3-dehydro-L-gulonate 2-dehydrogenase [Bacteroidales bacterium]MCF8389401.1 3-dehydro-L-gulonate 2-dehydrogenase [Bacteroidales bacterium]